MKCNGNARLVAQQELKEKQVGGVADRSGVRRKAARTGALRR
ncbi:MAG: hypothetical protein U5L05_10820 [Rubrivivax sp.]|nr:hypothetical protein [Rubrivivax sp.]MDZ7591155.1 hypothetical protein [Rubrivivax sp.]